ncbi:ATP-grasp domain-containing protein [Nakamurella panacisegetis]|uniref:ATP-grasp domain-containing protein n=1 Tax=Nakamurella panacisegetis TaxID=1090615 RepID=UPI000B86798C|nr:hypothetical protein [Nakamurella panacisegetis]
MPTILLLTAEVLPHDDYETALVAEALTDLGVKSQIVPWDADGLSDIPADLAVIRSTWDYTGALPKFLDVLGRLPMVLSNPVEVVRWNSHKGYLVELAEAGAPVVPTRLFRAADFAAGDPVVLPSFDTPEIVIKPAVSAGGAGVGRFADGSAAALDHLTSTLRTADALVQPFQPGVSEGERSLIHLGGVFSHAVRKTPAEGDYRVQERFGGSNRPHQPSGAELAAAAAALSVVPGGSDVLSYARVDLVGPEDNPLIMELELIEPELFLRYADGSAERLAKALAAMV